MREACDTAACKCGSLEPFAALSYQPKLAKTSPATGASRGSTASVPKVSRANVASRSASSVCSNVSMGCQSRRIHSAPTARVTTLFARQKAEMQLLCRKSRTPRARRHFTDRQRGRLCPSARDVTSRPEGSRADPRDGFTKRPRLNSTDWPEAPSQQG